MEERRTHTSLGRTPLRRRWCRGLSHSAWASVDVRSDVGVRTETEIWNGLGRQKRQTCFARVVSGVDDEDDNRSVIFNYPDTRQGVD